MPEKIYGSRRVSRRRFLAAGAVGLAGVTGLVAVGCGDDDGDASEPQVTTTRTPTATPESAETPASEPTKAPSARHWQDGGRYRQDVAGESFYQPALWTVAKESGPVDERRQRATAELHPEPTNEYDPNAIAVHVEGLKVGYLPREDAVWWVRAIGHGDTVPALIVGGFTQRDGRTAFLGVRLDLPPRP